MKDNRSIAYANFKDMKEKCDSHKGRKLTVEEVLFIRREWNKPKPCPRWLLAERFGVSVTTIKRIQLRHDWDWIPKEMESVLPKGEAK